MGIFDKLFGKEKNNEPKIQVVNHRQEKVQVESDGTYLITCPFCFADFRHDQVCFRSANDDRDALVEDIPLNRFRERVNLPTVLVEPRVYGMDAVRNQKWELLYKNPAKDGTGRIIRGIKEIVNGLPVENCSRVCPKCHNILPNTAGSKPSMIISIVGYTSVGKTVYMLSALNALLDDTRGAFGFTTFDVNTSSVDDDGEYQTIRQRYKNLMDQIESTEKAYVPPLTLRFTSTDNEVILSFFDFPGEALDDNNYYKNAGQHILKSSALLFLMDSKDNDIVRNYLGDEVDLGDENAKEHGYRTCVNDIWGNAIQASELNSYDNPIAVVFTKFDIIKSMYKDNEDGAYVRNAKMNANSLIFSEDPKDMVLKKDPADPKGRARYVDLSLVDKISDEIKEKFLVDIQQEGVIGSIDTLTGDREEAVRYFGVSALGFQPTEAMVNRNTDAAIRREEPLLWLLHELGFLEGRRNG